MSQFIDPLPNNAVANPALAANSSARYVLRREIGRGGVAVVHEAADRVTGRNVALKRLQPKEAPHDRERVVELFEREYHTLAQLAHPRIVGVYDYGVDELGPFYTMELLDGGDLQQLVPVPWKRACSVARDVCSALSLLHSRRLVHRDVSARNIRCTSKGLAKLLDFGAMIPMGPNKHAVVGTPPYVPPEVAQALPLDARSDLYSLGATLYLALVGQHAYPARTFDDLQQRWQVPPAPPSYFVPEIPAALDTLVLDLLQLDPAARPASAAEVIERVCAIDAGELDEHLLVAQAYLSTPMLVARSDEFALARRKINRLRRGHGSSMILDGASGVGRSRLLDACAIEAKLRGTLVLRADADDAQLGAYGSVRALARTAIEALRAEAAELAGEHTRTLAHIIPELVVHARSGTLPPMADTASMRGKLQHALREWFIALSRKKPLFIAIDDLHRADEPSLAWLALLVQDIGGHAIAVMTTVESSDATPALALKVFRETSLQVKLNNLAPEDTEKLLASVFGDVPNLGLVASRIHEVSAGNPRDTLRLAQHLLDRGVVRYTAGVWTLPARFDALDLPSSMTLALRSRVDALSDTAVELACAMALSPGLCLSFEECVALCEHDSPAHTMESLSELIRADIFRKAAASYVLSQQAWSNVVLDSVGPEERRSLHLRLARMFERRGNDSFRMAQHLIRGSEYTSGADAEAATARALEELTRSAPDDLFTFIQALPSDWFETYEEAIELSLQRERPKKEAYLLRSRLSALVSVGGTTDRVHLPALIEQLCEDSGLADYARLDAHDPSSRLMAALTRANERYNATPEQDRILPPQKAIRHLARVLIQTSAVYTSALDVPGARTLPSLSPLVVLSPALGVIEWMIKGMIARMTGHIEHAQACYAQVLEATSQPERAGLDASHNTNMRCGLMSGLGMIDAGIGLASSLTWAARIESEPLYQVNAAHIRMLHHLWQGNVREAMRFRQQVDVLRIQRSAQQFFEGTHLIWQIAAHALAGDLTRTKHTLIEINAMCQRYPDWSPVRDYGLGEYHRIRGDLDNALAAFDAGLHITRAGEQQIWPYLAGAQLHTLHELGRDREALELGERYLAAAEQSELGYLINYIKMPICLIWAALERHSEAAIVAEGVVGEFQKLGATGLNLGLAYETRARVALAAGDSVGFERYAELVRETFQPTNNSTLAARVHKLMRDWQGITTGERTRTEERRGSISALSTLDTCQTSQERAQRALACLADASGATGGYLFLLAETGTACVAQMTDHEPPPAIRALVEEYLAEQSREWDTRTGSLLGSTSLIGDGWHVDSEFGVYRPVLLSHSVAEGIAITGVAVLAVAAQTPFVPPGRLATELSRRVANIGDVSSLLVAS